MSSLLERRYRRVLRLLPAGYRHRWEEDMVGAFMDSTDATDPHAGGTGSSRPSLAERLSVAALAIRVRLDGSHATPRGLVWYQVVHGVALMVLLYQAVAATVSVAYGVGLVLESTVDGSWAAELQPPPILDFFVWSRVFGLLWVAAFGCFVFGRVAAARVLVVLAALSAVAVTVTTYILVTSQGASWAPFSPGDLSRWGWLAVSVAIVFVYRQHAHTSRRFWIGAYLVGSLILDLETLQPFAPLITPYWEWLRLADLTNVASAATVIAMAVALVTVVSGRNRSPHWLLALAAFAGGIGGVRLMTSVARDMRPLGWAGYPVVPAVLDTALIALALACGVVGLLAVRRMPDAS